MMRLYWVFVAALLISGCDLKTENQQTTKPSDTANSGDALKPPTGQPPAVKPGMKIKPRFNAARPAFVAPDRHWRPRKNFGPFRAGSDLSRIQVLLNGTNAQWYFNDFYQSFAPAESDALNVYRRYYRQNLGDPNSPVTLPTTPTPALGHTPGIYGQGGSGARSNEVLLALDEVACSSKYGGSILLTFKLADMPMPNNNVVHPEVYSVEFQKDGYRFDVGELKALMYVTPKLNLFNPMANHLFATPTHVEFEPNNIVAYQGVSYNSAGSATDLEPLRPVLKEILDAMAPSIANLGQGSGGRPPASVFAHAFMHNQFISLIGLNDKVTKLFLGDNFCDVMTEVYVPYIFVSSAYFFLDGAGSTDGLTMSDEYTISMRSFHIYADGTTEIGPTKKWEDVDAYDIVGPTSVGGWLAEACTDLNHIRLQVNIKEVDPFSPDDHYNPVIRDLVFDCAAVNARATASPVPQYGLVPNGLQAGGYESYGGVARFTDEVSRRGSSSGDAELWSYVRVYLVAR